MERVRRRWWTTTVSVFAVLVILAATASGLFQAAVLALPGYRDELSDWVTKVAGRPVEIGGVALVWHGIYPRLDLSDITLYDENTDDEVLTARRLSLGFGLLRALSGDFTPNHIDLSGLALGVQVDEQGHISVVGLDNVNQSTPPDFQKILRELARFGSVRLLNCRIELSAPQLPEKTVNLDLASVELAQTLSGFGLEGELSLPAAYGKRIDFEADVDGELDRPRSWNGGFRIRGRGLQPQPWLHTLILPGTGTALEGSQVDLRGTLQSGQVAALDARLQADTVLISRGGQTVANNGLDLLARATPAEDGWQFEVKHLQLDDEDQLRGGLHFALQPDGRSYALKAEVDRLRLDKLAQWLGYLRTPSPALALAARAGGEIDGLVLRLAHGDDLNQYALQAAFKNFSLRPGPAGATGVSGLNGQLVADDSGGHFDLTPGALRLELPHTLNSAVNLESIQGELRWVHHQEGWLLQVPNFAWKLASIAGQGQFNLLLPASEGASPVMDLSAEFSVADINQAKPFMPKFWSENLHKWLQRAIVGGRVSRGVLEIHGPLADFPFHQRPTGKWQLDLDAANVNLAYLPDWPALDQVKAHLRFSGNGLDIEASGANVLGNRLEQARARFADFSDAVLTLDAGLSGETARFYDFLNASPLKKTLSGLVDHTRARGPAAVDVHLDIPLHDADHTQVRGNVALDGVELRYQGLSEPLRQIRGNIGFSNSGATSDQLTLKFADLDVAGKILPRAGTHGVISAGFDYAIKDQDSGASAFVPGFLRKLVGGMTHWQAELPLADHAGLTLSSNLLGVAVPLPPPLGKRAEDSVPLAVTLLGADSEMRVKVDYRQRLAADIALAAKGSQWDARGISLFLGHGGTPAPPTDGLLINGNVDELDLAAWGGVLQQAHDGGLPLRHADLLAATVSYRGQMVHDVRMQMTPDAGGWVTQIEGGAEGMLNWRDSGAGTLQARLKKLNLDYHNSGAPAASTPDAAGSAFDPNRFPLLDIVCDQLTVGDLPLGKLSLNTQRVAGGQRIAQFSLSGDKTTFNADGWWKHDAGLSSAALSFKLQSENSAEVLKAFGYSPTLDARHSNFTADLAWAPDPGGVAWEQVRGRVGIDVKSGALRSVEPGAGRVLGLINLFALPRRLTLDFHDVVSAGLGFDTITGNYDLADGNAITNDLDVAAPSLSMQIRGRIGLAARDFDQKVMVHPSVSTGVTIGAALVGGPAAALIALLAQQVLKQPLDKVTQFSYRVTGPWDNPKVE